MVKVITYGTYDLLHYGHIALLNRAKSLGDYLIVGVTSDSFDKTRGKLNVQQSAVERIDAVKELGIADQIILEEYEGQKISDIQKYNVDIFTVGSDWVGKFDYINEYCKVVYIPRTQGISSTELRRNTKPLVKLGLIGIENPVERFVDECLFVSGVLLSGAFCEDNERLEKFCNKYSIKKYNSLSELLQTVDSVYISESINLHYHLIIEALKAGCHVLCESPIFLNTEQASHAFQLAKEKQLVLFEAIKTLCFPAFEHLLLLVNSGVIGTIKDIDVCCSIIPNNFEEIKRNKYQGSIYDWGAVAFLPIIKILGCSYYDYDLISFNDIGFNYLTRCIFKYPRATAAIKIGKGIKFEGDMIITGTKGYIYVPAPWWKTEYFEIRYEDLRETKKYFYKFDGEGIRYEINEFVKMINLGIIENYKYTKQEILASTKIIETYVSRYNSD